MPYRNPVIKGFYPDPSVCRVGEDYYLVTSSFEYFPGVPIFHSRDLVNWRQIGHCITRASQLNIEGCKASGGVYAPTLRHDNGRFYMVTTNVSGGGHFILTADDPAGEWSEPIRVKGPDIDPSLLFDDGGKVYFSWRNKGALYQMEINPDTGEWLTEPRELWKGSGYRGVEGPHLYKINGMYYLIAAEAGTEYTHLESCARSESPWGPWEPCPHNPILTHRGLGSGIQCTGHGDLIEAHDGSWWMVFLGVRVVWYPPVYHLGRETFLAPVIWEDGWPVVNGGKPIEFDMDVPTLPQQPWPTLPDRDDFESETFDLRWNWLRNPHMENYSLSERPGFLRLHGTAVSLDEADSPTWIGRRQTEFDCRAETVVEFDAAGENEQAGLSVWMNERHHYDLFVTRRGGQRMAVVHRRIGTLFAETGRCELPEGPVRLIVEAEQKLYHFKVAIGEGEPTHLDTGESRYLSTEVAGGFTGVYLACFASGNGEACKHPADFASFALGSPQA